MATKKKATIEVKEEKVVETPKEEKKIEKKYVVLTAVSYPVEVSKEQYEEIKNSADKNCIVESETDDTIYIRINK